MKLTRCENGHFYDADRFHSCPQCADDTIPVTAPEGADADVTIPLSAGYAVNGGVDESGEGVTIPLTGGDSITFPVDPTGGDEGVTVPAYQLNNPAAEKDVKSAAAPCAGWLVCVKGRYMGRDFRLQFGKNTIGRKETNSICLSGDVGVSREPQAIVVYEPASNRFFAIPGTARELAYINGEVLLERVELHKNDVIEMGETQLIFIPCCDDAFNWSAFCKK